MEEEEKGIAPEEGNNMSHTYSMLLYASVVTWSGPGWEFIRVNVDRAFLDICL